MKYERIKAGDTLWDVHSYGMGNTTLRSLGCWGVLIVRLDPLGAWVRWNGNREELWYRRQLERLRAKEPEMESYGFGQRRIKRKVTPAPTPKDVDHGG